MKIDKYTDTNAIQRYVKRLGEAFKDLLDNDELSKSADKAGETLKAIWQGKASITADTIKDIRALTNNLHWSVKWAEEVAEMPAENVKDYLRERIRDIAIEQYPVDTKKPPTVERFGQYVFCICASHLEILLLLEKYELTGEFRQWVLEYAKECCYSAYGMTPQGLLPNQLRQIGRRTGSGMIDNDALIYNGENVKLAFFESDRHKGVAMTVPMQKVLSMYHEELCKKLPLNWEELGRITLEELDKYSSVTITLDKYMELTGTKDKKTARAAIKDACDRLYFLSYVVIVKGKEYRGRLFSSMVETSYGGKFEMRYTPEYLRYCATTNPAAFHKGMYKINGKQNPYSWGIGEKLWQHFMMNRGKASSERLSVKKLLEAVPDIPTYAEVMEGNRVVNQRIIEPVERDLDELKNLGVLKSWEYSNAKGAKLTAEQLADIDYNTWHKLYISFVLDLPPQDEYIEAYQKRLAAAKKKAAKRKA